MLLLKNRLVMSLGTSGSCLGQDIVRFPQSAPNIPRQVHPETELESVHQEEQG